MDESMRRRMLGWAARARANPRFGMEEREHRLTVAAQAADLLDAAGRGEPVAALVEALRAYMQPRLPEIVVPRQMGYLARWAEEDDAAVALALRTFDDPHLDEAARVQRFGDLLAERGFDGFDGAIALVVGSLFNFARAPGRLPVVRAAVYAGLAGLLGEPAPEGPVADRYAAHLGQARRMQQTLRDAGVTADDMLDTEALMLICWQDREFWAQDDDGRRPRSRAPERYLTACAIYRDEAPYLPEWIEFHRIVGFERFYLYDNGSADDHLTALAPYVEDGLVVVHEWPEFPGQFKAYDHCVRTHGGESRWIAFFDIDEFLFSPAYRPVPEVLAEYEQWPGVCVNLPRFGTSGHRTKPDGLVIESYLTRLEVLANRTVKSIVDPSAVDRCRNAHEFFYNRRTAVDENGYPVHSTATKSPSFERLRANHYYSKSEEELRAKHTRQTADYAWDRRPLPDSAALARHEAAHGVRDETILPYAERVREALAKRAPARGSL